MKSQLVGKDLDAGKDWGQKENGMTEDEMVGWDHWLNRHEFEQTVGDSEGQGSLECYSSWGHRVGHDLVTEQQQFWIYLHLEYCLMWELLEKSQIFLAWTSEEIL